MKEQVSTLEKGANILLSLMQLNIGGAETHVVELAKELKRKGFNVIVTSNGGVYVKELEDAGIKHEDSLLPALTTGTWRNRTDSYIQSQLFCRTF